MRWPFTRAYEIATLGLDAARVCEDAERRFRPEEVRALADALRGRLEGARRRLGQPRMGHDNVLSELRGCHREARRRRRDRDLSELTLAIIRIRAEKLGADEAARTIDRFLERWPAAGMDAAEAKAAAAGTEAPEGRAAAAAAAAGTDAAGPPSAARRET